MATPEIIHVTFDGYLQRTVTQDGTALDISAATKVAVEFYDDPGDPICSFNTTDDEANFSNTLGSGIIKFLWTSSTFTSYLASLIDTGKFRGRHNCRIIV
ncbi:MAG TPA: hypothetical protein VMW24_19260, partial [Sedimentisphaerales bacterium]|nr:hypothetical protein [Sedimentisphaerales bacterium]